MLQQLLSRVLAQRRGAFVELERDHLFAVRQRTIRGSRMQSNSASVMPLEIRKTCYAPPFRVVGLPTEIQTETFPRLRNVSASASREWEPLLELANLRLAVSAAVDTQRWSTGLLRQHSLGTIKDYDAVVTGSGSGGLTAALALARAGRRVVVVEQHYLSPGHNRFAALGPGGGLRRLPRHQAVVRDSDRMGKPFGYGELASPTVHPAVLPSTMVVPRGSFVSDD